MTMHLVGPYLTTTNYRPRKAKNKSKAQLATDAAHAKFLKKMGYKGNGVSGSTVVSKTNSEGSIPSSSAIPSIGDGVGYNPGMSRRKENVYSGERKLLGVATMHKSNMVPVFSSEDAEAISKMRRG